MRSAAYPDDIFSMWVRDEYITFPVLPDDKDKVAQLLAEKILPLLIGNKL